VRHWVIGDVHGELTCLEKLVSKIPPKDRLIFVGDLIDRGPESFETVVWVKKCRRAACVMGNHEYLMLTEGAAIFQTVKAGHPPRFDTLWCRNGGIATLRSYGLVELIEGRPRACYDRTALQHFEAHLTWMANLPLYLELPVKKANRPVVVSHAPVATHWHMRLSEAMSQTFRDIALWNRREPDENAPVFNIFGHTPTPFGPDIQPHYVNVDTGCYRCEKGMGKLSAYCVEEGEILTVSRHA